MECASHTGYFQILVNIIDLHEHFYDLMLIQFRGEMLPIMEAIMRKFITALLFIFSTVVHAENKITYPKRAEMLRIGGEINVLYDISREGKTENIRIIRVNPKYVFDRDVKRQIATWNYPKNDQQKDVVLRVVFKAN